MSNFDEFLSLSGPKKQPDAPSMPGNGDYAAASNGEGSSSDPINVQDSGGTSVIRIEDVTITWKDPEKQQYPVCPVFVTKTAEGNRVFSAYIYGTIRDVDNYVDLIDTLLTANENDEYNIYIDSCGGMIASGGIIASAIHHSKATVRTISRGICASAAALIHSSAKKENIIVNPHSIMMYHMSSHMDYGYSTLIRDRAANQVRYVNECLLNKALEEGHISQDEFDKIQGGEEIYVSGVRFVEHREETLGERDLNDLVNTDTAVDAAPGNDPFNAEDAKGDSVASSEGYTETPVKFDFRTYGFFDKIPEMAEETMCGGGCRRRNSGFTIRTHDKTNFRVYINADWDIRFEEMIKIGRFLDSRTADQTVTLIFGVSCENYSSHMLGSLISSILSCKATVNTLAAGFCGMMETMIWAYGKEASVYRYGALTFGMEDEFIKMIPEFKYYYQESLNRIKGIGMITDAEYERIVNKHDVIVKMYGELRGQSNDVVKIVEVE